MLVGDPTSPDPIRYPPLVGARREVEALAALYSDPDHFVGAEATADVFLAAIDGASIVHYAGHAVSSPSQPAASHLVLAADSDHASGLLFAGALAERDFQAPDLLVLTACGSLAPDNLSGGGFWGVAQPFLARGTTRVLGALWSVGDIDAEALSMAFHRALREGAPPAEALRIAQVEMHREGEIPPREWAAFQLLGVGLEETRPRPSTR